jgi:hypothetical protein
MLQVRRPNRWKTPIAVGLAVYALHFGLCTALFATVHINRQSQGEFAWMLFMELDYPSSGFLWDHLADTRMLTYAMDWGYTWGSGANLRAFLIHAIFGGLQWFLLGFVAYALVRALRAECARRSSEA